MENIGKVLINAIEIYADAKGTGNSGLVSLALGNLNASMEDMVILTKDDKAKIEESIGLRDEKIAELEGRLAKLKANQEYADEYYAMTTENSVLGGK